VIYMLCEAAELEHGIMCQYLFAALSLKQGIDEGLSEDEAAAVARWRARISRVATQEMLHLALVHNLLSAIGAAPHLARPNLPQPANYYPAGVQLRLLPFGEEALQHFMFLERPEGMDLADAEGLAAIGRAIPALSERDIVPRGQDFATVGHLYRSIEAGLAHLADLHGEDWLFVGPPLAQATIDHFGWPELIPVTGLASTQRAIDQILEQGEGPRGDWQNAHFGQFVEILDEYQQMRDANPGFDPVRPVLAVNVRPHEDDVEVPLISDPLTARVTDLFNVSYEILLQILERFFAHTEETDAQLKTLADITVGLMIRVIKPLGNLITTLPTPTPASRSRSSTTAASASTRACAPTGCPPCSAPPPSPSWRPAAGGWTRSSAPCGTARPVRSATPSTTPRRAPRSTGRAPDRRRSRSPRTGRTGSLAASPSPARTASPSPAPRATRRSTARCAGAGSRATSRSAAACTGT